VIRIDTADIPEAGPRDLLIKVAQTGICGTDLAFFREGRAGGRCDSWARVAGPVIAAGAQVEGVAVGDRVVANPMIDLVGLGRVAGSFAEYLRLPAADPGRNVFPLPLAISDEIGALIEPFAVGLHAVNRSRARAGEKVVIYGAGPIGLCVLASLKARRVEQVLVVDPSEKRLSIALAMGANAAHDPRAGSAPHFVAEHFGDERLPFMSEPLALADVAFDCAGVAPAIDDAVHSLARRGRLVLVADPHDVALAALRLVHAARARGSRGARLRRRVQ
jgi:threonine dehydrogenase-like Zn-dependent dehydrogenase